MAFEYLKELGLPDDVTATLRNLGARTPGALLSMCEHSREKFVRFLGEEQTDRLYAALLKIVPEEEREKLRSLPHLQPSMGALFPQSSRENTAALQQRDALMKDIELLRASKDDSPEKQQLLATLEQRLRDLLKVTVTTSQQ
jgi:hypothetical protein